MNGEESSDFPMHLVLPQIMHLYFLQVQRLLDGSEIHPGQIPLLLTLHHHDGASQKELVGKLRVRPPTMTVMLQRMERTGLVERCQDEKDQRVSRIFITQKGEEVIQSVNDSIRQMEEWVFRGFSKEEILLMKRLFLQMRDNLIE